MILHDSDQFLDLSGEIFYSLDAAVESHESTLATILNGSPIATDEREILLGILDFLAKAYATKRRRLGPPAVIHPLRATALLVRAQGEVALLDLLTVLLHDKDEDIIQEEYDETTWAELDGYYRSIVGRLDSESNRLLAERIDALTRRKNSETYYQYMGRLLERSQKTPALVRLKLTDRLDNILDVRVDRHDTVDRDNFYGSLIQMLFTSSFQGFAPDEIPHPPRARLDSARRLYELFKNTVALNLVRQTHAIKDDATAALLFTSIAHAGLREAQRIMTHIFAHHLRDPDEQRALVLDTMRYCQAGGLELVTAAGHGHRLDGLFQQRFDAPSSKERKAKLAELKEDKPLMVAGSIAFAVIFLCFLNNPDFFVRGITPDGIVAE